MGKLSESVKKILSLKAKSNLDDLVEISSENIVERVNTSKDTLLYSRAIESAITLVKNSSRSLPLLKDKKYLHVSFGNESTYLFNKLKKYINIDYYNSKDYNLLYEKTKYDGIVISYHGSSSSPYASNIIPKNISEVIEKIGKNNNVILTLFLNPYSLNSFEKIDNFNSIIFSTPLLPITTGTPTYKFLTPYSPFK